MNPFVFSKAFNEGEVLSFNESTSLVLSGGRFPDLFQDVPPGPLFAIIHASAGMFLLTSFIIINVL